MKHTPASRNLANSYRAASPLDKKCEAALQLASTSAFSCAYATAKLMGGLDQKRYQGYDVNEADKKTNYELMKEWCETYRKPIVFTGIAGKQGGALTKLQLEKFHKQGKYLDIKYLSKNQSWHANYWVYLFIMEVK